VVVGYRSRRHPKSQHFDTDNSVQAVDVEIKISKAGSGFDPS
jgi:hypothetical protein